MLRTEVIRDFIRYGLGRRPANLSCHPAQLNRIVDLATARCEMVTASMAIATEYLRAEVIGLFLDHRAHGPRRPAISIRLAGNRNVSSIAHPL